jgi:hypothetical protein
MVEVPRLEVVNERKRLQEELLRALSNGQEEEASNVQCDASDAECEDAPCIDC